MDLPIHTAAAHSPASSTSILSDAAMPPSLIQRRPSTTTAAAKPANADGALGAVNGCMAAIAPTEDYEPRVILLTGGAGFIGSHVVDHLVFQYPHYHVIVLDKLEYCATINNLSRVKDRENFTFVKGDICSMDLVNHLLKSERVDTIMHFAAQTHVDNSFGLALDFTRTNIFGTHTLLEAAKHIHPQIERFIHVSTDEVYGESLLDSSHRLTELSPLNPSNPYAATKVAAEYLVRSYHHSFGIPTIITRGNNVYGPRQYPEKLIPKFILRLRKRLPVQLHGDGSHRRSFLYADDVSRAFDCILHKGEVGHIYNIGSDSEVTNRDVAMALLEKFQLKPPEQFIEYVRDRAYNDLRYFIDTSGLKSLGWRKRIPWCEGLRRTIDWYLENPGHWGDIGDEVLAAHPRVDIRMAAEE